MAAGVPSAGGLVCSAHGNIRSIDALVDDGGGGLRCGPHALCVGPQRVIGSTALAMMGPAGSMGGTLSSVANLGRIASVGGMVGAEARSRPIMPVGTGGTPIGVFSGGQIRRTGIIHRGAPSESFDDQPKYREPWSEEWEAKPNYGKVAARGSNAQSLCIVHNKTRNLSCLDEQPDGTFICKPTHRCKTAETPKFHTVSEAQAAGELVVGLGKPIMVVSKTNLVGSSSSTTIPKIHWKTKRTLCSFWQQGNCSKGDKCTYAHGEEELGQDIPGYLIPDKSEDRPRATPY